MSRGDSYDNRRYGTARWGSTYEHDPRCRSPSLFELDVRIAAPSSAAPGGTLGLLGRGRFAFGGAGGCDLFDVFKPKLPFALR